MTLAGLKTFIDTAVKLMQVADSLVAADASRQGITKEEAWDGARAASLIQAELTAAWILDLADPFGWRTAARVA